jgi:hypothetical protein
MVVLLLELKRSRKEFKDFVALISLKLNDFSQFLALNYSSVACEILILASSLACRVYLLECFQNSLKIIFCRDTLNGSQSLTTVALLNTDMNVILMEVLALYGQRGTYATGTGSTSVVACIGEGVFAS